MCSFSPVRTPKLQLAAEQPSSRECWIPPKKGTPPPRAKDKPQQDGRRGEIAFRIKPLTSQRRSERSEKPCEQQDPETPTDTETELCLTVSCKGTGQRWPATGQGLWVQQTQVWHKPSRRRSPLTPPESCQNLHRTGETDSWKAQTDPWAHQDPRERSSDPTRD